MAASLVTAPAERNMIRTPIYITIESGQMSGTEAPYTADQDNLYCVCEVWEDPPSGDPVLLARLRAPYSTDDKRVTFDIAPLIPRTLSLPSAASIGISPSTPYHDEADDLTKRIYLKYADAYGIPVVAETLTQSDTFLCINGGLPADAVQDINWPGALLGLHSYFYKRADAYPFRKPVSMMQPDWIYYVSQVADDISIVVTIHYGDGTYDTYTAISAITLVEDKGYWIQSGYNQLKVDDHADTSKDVVGYDVSLIRATGGQNAFTAFYIIDDECPSWERYLLYQNGMGGYETVRLKGIMRHSHEVQRDRFERTRWSDFSITDGVTDDLTTFGGPVFTAHTGHYPSWYLDHLRQLLHGKLWIIDTDLSGIGEYRFKRILCDTNSVDIRSDRPGPGGFSFTYRHAWKDDGYNVY